MKKYVIVLLSLLALLSFSQFSFAANASKDGNVVGHLYDPASGKAGFLKKNSAWATEAMVINNTTDLVSVEVPFALYDWVSPNRAYQILTNLSAVNVRLWHPDFGYVYNDYIVNYTIISLAIENGRANVITVTYR